MANVYWNLPPRKAALLILRQEVLPPWLKLADISNFNDLWPSDTFPGATNVGEITERAVAKRRKPPEEGQEAKGIK